ncbi:MAG TPA: type I phosphomannose isomerase catalytic subunit [Terracidiphilus sp.]|nr:type I phosphomannose isomerase catalytic subunit [Terracidiphilus sp.]
MAAQELGPFRVEPRFDTRVWGFRDLRPWYNRVAEGDPIGEVWLTGDDCLIATGPYMGKKLAQLFGEAHEALLGPQAPSPESPLLIKMLFAKEKLSVQVHPDDKLAQKYGQPRGKTECWYALAAEPDAKVAVGLKPGVTLEQVKEEIHAGTLESSLAVLQVERGDMIFVDAGTVHAIWPGAIILETQQNCDITYRMFDYGRPRELHVEKSIEATKLATRAGKFPPRQLSDRTVLIDVEYFRVEKMAAKGSYTSHDLRGVNGARSLTWLFAAAGAGQLSGQGFDPVDLPARGIVGVPAASPEFVLEDRGGLELIRIIPNWPGTKP